MCVFAEYYWLQRDTVKEVHLFLVEPCAAAAVRDPSLTLTQYFCVATVTVQS